MASEKLQAEFEKEKKAVDKVREKHLVAKAQLQDELKRLKEDMGLDSLEAVRKKHEETKKLLAKGKKKAEVALVRWRKKWKERLNELSESD